MSTSDLFETLTRESSPAVKALHEARLAACCRGSVALGSGCGRCMRCQDEIAKLRNNASLPRSDHAEVGTPTCNANILALDIGTQLGWAMGLRDGKLTSGSESFAARKHEGPGQRWLKFTAFLGQKFHQAGELQAVYYELVMAHGRKDQPNTIAAHVYGGFVAHLEAWADRNRIPLVGVSVGTIKRSATGKGNAKKPEMVAAMRAAGHKVIDDNHADALALLRYAQQQEA